MLISSRFQPSPFRGRTADPDEAHVMRDLQRGEASAFEALYDRHARAVHGLAFRMLQDRQGAEEVTQETFLSLWRSRDAYVHGLGTPRTWVLSIARNRAIDAIRRRPGPAQVRFEMDFDTLEAPERTEDEVLLRSDADAVNAAMRSLPEAQRSVLDLAYFGGFSQSEISARLQVPLGTVKGRMRLGLQKLASQLEPPLPSLS
jgi:RNA polymerase sigma-70 factor, ECF subfamily